MHKIAKQIHGEPIPFWKKLGLEPLPPIECPFAVGDTVIYTNDYGVKFKMDIIGFSKDTSFYGRFIHLKRHEHEDVDGCAWWCPCSPQEITPIDTKGENR